MRTREELQKLFEDYEVPVAFLTVTQTQLNKSIMDAVKPLRELLKEKGVHDYSTQEQGTHAKVVKVVNFIIHTTEIVGHDVLYPYSTTVEEKVTLYRPTSGNGDPRIWFTNLKKYAHAGDVLVVMANDEALYVVNATDDEVLNEIEDPDSILGQVIEKVGN